MPRTGRSAFLLILVSLLAGALVDTQGRPIPGDAREPDQAVLKNVWDGVYTEAQAERGGVVYRRVCGYCHRDNLLGDEGPPLDGVDFTYRWDNLTVARLFETIATKMPPRTGTVASPLSRQEYADIVSFLFSSNGLPPGTAELPSDLGKLEAILFTRMPPKE